MERDDMPYLSDDPDRERDGVHETPLSATYEHIAMRDELASKIEALLEDARDWAEASEDEGAKEIFDILVELYERLGESLEESDP